ncbi:MAG: hypothetical protein GC164_07960 [Phycisphaera sp.]|nr:hypothetical protein [Phycisphaera sp.]
MTSKQVMPIGKAHLCVALIVCASCCLVSCQYLGFGKAKPQSPYTSRRVWAVAPLRNESGTQYADSFRTADHLARQLEEVANIDVLPVNRTLEAMTALKMNAIATKADAMRLLTTLGADALVVGSITAWEPYDPPKIGMALELYVDPRINQLDALDLRKLTRASTGPETTPVDLDQNLKRQPVSVVSAFLDAADPSVRDMLKEYADKRGPVGKSFDWHRYRMSMDLFTEFASYVMGWRLVEAEKQRLAPPPPEGKNPEVGNPESSNLQTTQSPPPPR